MGKEIETREKGEGTNERAKDIYSRRTKDCLWTERRQTWPVGKWQLVKVTPTGREEPQEQTQELEIHSFTYSGVL